MNFSENYYYILGVSNRATDKEIKKAYYKLSFKHHPDRGGNDNDFKIISEAYTILIDEKSKIEYDNRSKWGKSYDEKYELFDYEFSNSANMWDDDAKLNDFKKKEGLNIICYIDEEFDGSIEYERFVICKKCNGTGKDSKSKITIRDDKGKTLKIFDSDGGCDFCEGSGKDYLGNDCNFCFGQGKTGSNPCKNCKGQKRILGKQKLSGIIFPDDEKDLRVDFMGNFSKDIPGKVGHLWVVRKISDLSP